MSHRSISIPADLDKLDDPKPDSWYIRMMIKRLEWEGCEDRETVILLFKSYWPRHAVASRAEEFYDKALEIMGREK